MTNENKNENKTAMQKFSAGFTVFCILFLILKFTGLIDPIVQFFKN